MIASMSIKTFAEGKQYDYITPDTLIWIISEGINIEGALTKSELMLKGDAKERYSKFTSKEKLSYEKFKRTIASPYLTELLHDKTAMRDLVELASMATCPDVKIALVGENEYESTCVRSILIGILQGAKMMRKYVTDGLDHRSGWYTEYYDMLPWWPRTTIAHADPEEVAYIDRIFKS